MQELFDLVVERCTAYNNLLEFTAEGLYELIAYLAVYDLVDSGDFKHIPDRRFLQYRSQLVAVDLFENERHAYDEVRLHL